MTNENKQTKNIKQPTTNVALKLNSTDAEQELYKKFKQELKQLRTKYTFTPETQAQADVLVLFADLFNNAKTSDTLAELKKYLQKYSNSTQETLAEEVQEETSDNFILSDEDLKIFNE